MPGLMPLLVIATASTSSAAGMPDPNPWQIDDGQAALVQTMIVHAEAGGIDPYTFISLAWVESNIRPDVASPTGDFGLFQVNCKLWWRPMGFISWSECKKAMFDPAVNTAAALQIFILFSGWETCRGSMIFQCYNGGPGWMDSENREQIERYATRAKDVLRRLKLHYTRWIERCREAHRGEIVIADVSGKS